MQEVATAKQEQAKAQRRAREALGTQEAEGELARRDKELADARAALRLLESWPRPREIEAAEARLARLQEEVRYLEDVQRRLRVVTPVGGLVSTPRLKEKVGQYLREGDLICVVEEPAGLEVELTVDESDVGRVCPGQVVELKCRAFPLEMLTARVDRVAPRASRTEPPTTAPSSARGEFSSTQVVYCRLEGADPGLRPGMTGQARVCLGRGRVWEVLSDRVLRYFRSELWW
jgi:multidrug resistance efflux pump